MQTLKKQCFTDYTIELFHMNAWQAVFFVSDSGLGLSRQGFSGLELLQGLMAFT